MNATRIPTPEETLAAWRAGALDGVVRDVLKPLIGEPFMELGRAADLIWLGFGEIVDAPTRRDPERRVARHRVHASCPLRLDSTDEIVVASSDIYRPADDSEPYEDFEWDTPGANLFDASVAGFWADHEPGFSVLERVSADPLGGLQLELASRYAIKIFPSRSGATEHWRYFRIDSEDHFVVVPASR